MIAFIIALISYITAGLGLGGGVILIPVLTAYFNIDQLSAQYISLLAYIPAAITIIILSKNYKKFFKVIHLVPIGIIGAIVGTMLAHKMNVIFVRKIYGVFLLIFGLNLLLKNIKCFKKSI